MDQPGIPAGDETNTDAKQQQQGPSDIAASQTIHDDSPDFISAVQRPIETESKSDSASQSPTVENPVFSVSAIPRVNLSSLPQLPIRMPLARRRSFMGLQNRMSTDSKSESAYQDLTSEISFSSGLLRPTPIKRFASKHRQQKKTDSESDLASQVLSSDLSSTEWPAPMTGSGKPIKPIEGQRDDVSELTEASDALPPPSIGSEPPSNSASQFSSELRDFSRSTRIQRQSKSAFRFLSEVSDAIAPPSTGSEPRSNSGSRFLSEVSDALPAWPTESELPPQSTVSEPRSNWASQFQLGVSDAFPPRSTGFEARSNSTSQFPSEVNDELPERSTGSELPPRSTGSEPQSNWASQFQLGVSDAPPQESTGFERRSDSASQFPFIGTPSTHPTNLMEKKGKPVEKLDGNFVGLVIRQVLANWFQSSSGVACQYQDYTEKGKGKAVETTVDSEGTEAEYLDCLAYCNLFPMGYEIEGDDLVQLWIAAGLIEREPMEFFALAYLDVIFSLTTAGLDFISLTRADCSSGEKWYKFQAHCPGLTTTNTEGHFCALFGDQHLNLDSVSGFDQVRTLLLSQGHRSSQIDHIPYGFFASLEHLRALDLSGTKMSELPSSVGGAKSLRYLNLSETFIQELPETICFLPNLQTLKLRNCSRLVALPEAMGMITSLRHLDLGPLCDLCSMPPQMGALTRLSTLSNFIVGTEPGCCIGELKNLHSLRGKVCLSRLENVRSADEAKEAQLQHKPNITKLKLKWTDSLEWENVNVDDCEEVIHHLQPPKGLQDLDILCYGGSRFPTWISLPGFDKLASIILFKCENCQFLPSLGQLPSLESLTLIELVQVRIMDLNFCMETTTPYHDNFVAFPKLLRLEMESMLRLEEWREMGNIDYFPCLTKLVIKDCPHLATLCRLSNVRCLEYLELNSCGKLPSLPEGGLPVSVKKFVIDDCPLLCSSCNNSLEVEQGWHKTEHTSGLVIYSHISP